MISLSLDYGIRVQKIVLLLFPFSFGSLDFLDYICN